MGTLENTKKGISNVGTYGHNGNTNKAPVLFIKLNRNISFLNVTNYWHPKAYNIKKN